ncbi:MAG: cytochrome c maturation protein CcmE [Coxiellaceae bacterium]|nr:MAG: cytochrome c maturation protein CcmE [Coxiellaceae bacterium]
MKPQRRRRLLIIMGMMTGISCAAGFILYALRQNIDLYYTPSQLHIAQLTPQQTLRLGGMVVKGSVHYATEGLTVQFVLSDYQQQVSVQYTGVLPALFREGQGVVVHGKLVNGGIFLADQVLAKHDEKYMPPSLPAKQEY